MGESRIDNVACTRCACVCDDLSLIVRDDRIVAAEKACRLAEPFFLRQNTISRPAALIGGIATDVDEAVEEAARLLRQAKSPLIYGLSRSSTEGQRAAVALADQLGATIDTTASEGHAPSLIALQQSGESTCSLGEIRHRADLVIFWGADPSQTHPRHLERYALWPTGDQVPRGRADRTLITINSTPTETEELADVALRMPPGKDFAALWTLRALLKGLTISPEAETGLPLNVLQSLADRMKSCRCGVIFFGYGLARQTAGHRVVEALLRLVIDLNERTRFHARRLRMLGDVAGADNVLCWQTGYPFSVNLSRGYPRYNPGEYSAAEMLARGDADVCLFVGSDRVFDFPPAAKQALQQIPTILLDPAHQEPLWQPSVQFTTAVYGVHLPGTAYRMDDVPIRLRPSLSTSFPSDRDILTAIAEACMTVPAQA